MQCGGGDHYRGLYCGKKYLAFLIKLNLSLLSLPDYKEKVKCTSGTEAYRSCDKISRLEERKFWIFELVCALTGGIRYCLDGSDIFYRISSFFVSAPA